ncbi:MAG TPA: BlaI/MecI/CopY family transcriptional regulator [Gemmatimonas sp.]|nr:BlaI/MecI/CopY family transcriptional regulator [Gemmatimonas sp.]
MANSRKPLPSSTSTVKRSTPRSTDPKLHDTVRLSADGLAKVLGDLEARVMAAVWSLDDPSPARAVHTVVSRTHTVAPLTVITVLNKLVAKRLLVRKTQDGLLHYAAVMTEPEFMAHASRRVVEGILSFGPEAVAASLVDVLAEQDPEQLEDLARLIRRRLKG